MQGYSEGDVVWCSFATIQVVRGWQAKAWVYPMKISHVDEEGNIYVTGHDCRPRVIDPRDEIVTRTEAEAWRACRIALFDAAAEATRMAIECSKKCGEVTHVVA